MVKLYVLVIIYVVRILSLSLFSFLCWFDECCVVEGMDCRCENASNIRGGARAESQRRLDRFIIIATMLMLMHIQHNTTQHNTRGEAKEVLGGFCVFDFRVWGGKLALQFWF